MKSKRTRRFRALFAELPESVQRQANDAYRLFQANPSHPGLSFKQVSPNGPVYSVRIGLHYRALAIRKPDYLLWFWIGSHAEYDKMQDICNLSLAYNCMRTT